jgi:hypothetical protein
MNNVDHFNDVCARTFATLFEAFPQPLDLDYLKVAELDADGGADEAEVAFIQDTLQWLHSAGYIWVQNFNTYGAQKAVLSPKGLEALKVTPETADTSKPIGERIAELVRGGAAESARQLMGQAFTGVFKLYSAAMGL